MEKMKYLLIVLSVAMLLTGCEQQTADIVIHDNCITAASLGETNNAVYERFDRTLLEWREAHPEVVVSEQKRGGSGEISMLGVLGTDHMPDIFMAGPVLGWYLAENDLVMDLSEYVQSKVFAYRGATYAFPVLEPSTSVLIKDAEWDEGGSIAWSGSFATDILGPLLAARSGSAWLTNMVEGNKTCAFTDSFFVNVLWEALLLCEQLDQMTGAQAIDAFVSGYYHAVLLNGMNVNTTLDRVRETDKERYASIAIGGLIEGYIPTSHVYGLFINANVAENPEKLALCLDLCRSLAAIEQPDGCPMLSLCFPSQVWGIIDNSMTAEAIAMRMQDKYEEYYLSLR